MREKISESEIDINKKDFTYESPDGGKTIYRSDTDHRSVKGQPSYKPTAYDDVSGITLGDEFDSYHDTIIMLKTRISQLEATIREIRKIIK